MRMTFADLMSEAPIRKSLWDGIMTPSASSVASLPIVLAQSSSQVPTTSNGVRTISEGPEYNKWDEALAKYGRIRIPKELDNPQSWLNQPHLQPLLRDIDRQDLPDGSVILSKITPTS